MSDKNLLVIGSESHVIKDFIERYGSSYSNIVGIDQYEKSDYTDYYLSCNFNQDTIFELLDEFFKKTQLHFSHVIFAAGVNYMNDVFGANEEEWDITFNVNVKAALFAAKALYNYFAPTASVVFIASQNGVVAHSQRIDYGTSKSALIHLAKNLSVDYARIDDKDIRINSLSPSYIKTNDNKDYLNSYIGKKMLARIPYRKFVTLKDVSDSIHFLLSDKSKSIRGQNLILDYGYTIV